MSISLTGTNHGLGTSIALPAHSQGNCLVVIALKHASTTVPSLPAGWINVHNATATQGSVRVGIIHAQNSSMTSGVWTNADALIALVLSDPGNFVVVEPVSTNSAGAATNIPFNTDPITGTFPTNILDTGVFAFHYNQSITNNVALAPTGMTNLLTGGNGVNYQYALHAQFPRTTVWPTTSVAMAASAAYRTGTFIAKSYTPQLPTTSAIIDPLSHSMFR